MEDQTADKQVALDSEGTLLDFSDTKSKTCKTCGKQYVIDNKELEFLKKISLVFNDKTYEIPASNYCPICRQQMRLAWRNERKLYKRKCDKTGKDIVTVYSPDKKFKVYAKDVWNSDTWDPMQFGKEFDPSKSFFDQFADLMKEVPWPATYTTQDGDSDYSNFVWNIKNSYLCFNSGYTENVMYSQQLFYSKDCVDCLDIKNCELCYECIDCARCYSSRYLDRCADCSNSAFSYDCKGCQNIFLCSTLSNKQYCIENKQYSKEEYFEKIKQYETNKRSSIAELIKKFNGLKEKAIHKENHNVKSENCKGDYLIESNNCYNVFNAYKSSNCYFTYDIDSDGKDSRDLNNCGEMELCYSGSSISGYKNQFSYFIVKGNDSYYCDYCQNCKDCFGCIGLKNKQYCILNKQYTKEEYEKKVAEIIGEMNKTGDWGEFFPIKMSPFGYNETMAQEYFPLNKDAAIKLGTNWQDISTDGEYSGQYIVPDDDINLYAGNQGKVEELLRGVIKSDTTGKPFQIMPREIAFYIENKIPVPTERYDIRYQKRFSTRAPRVLYHSQCDCNLATHGHQDRCDVEFDSTYKPERTAKVYCEKCWEKEA